MNKYRLYIDTNDTSIFTILIKLTQFFSDFSLFEVFYHLILGCLYLLPEFT